MTKLLILGLDGIGAEATEEFNLFPYLSTQGRVYSDGISLKTPPIWSALLVGEKNTGINDFPRETKKKDFGQASEHENDLYYRNENPDEFEPWDGGIGNRRDELIKDPWIEDYSFETVNFPVYDYTTRFNDIGDYQLYWGAKFLDGEISPKELVRKFSKESRDILERTYKKVGGSDIVLSYIHDTDYICHLTYMHHRMRKPVMAYWTLLSNQINQLLDKLSDDTEVFMLSDHGSSIGRKAVPVSRDGHSKWGFWGFLKEKDLPQEIHITEFQEILEEEL